MRVACLDCETSFNIPIEKILSAGQSVKCCRCGLVFGVKPKEPIEAFSESPVEEKRRISALTLILLLMLAAMAAYILAVKPSYMSLLSSEGVKKFTSFISGDSSGISPTAPKGSYLEREDGSRIFVMTGWVENSSSSILVNPEVTGTVYGSGGETLASASSYSGTTLTEADLLAMDESLIIEKLGQAPSESVLYAGDKAPFIVVIPNPPAEIVEYDVTVK